MKGLFPDPGSLTTMVSEGVLPSGSGKKQNDPKFIKNSVERIRKLRISEKTEKKSTRHSLALYEYRVLSRNLKFDVSDIK